MNNLNCVVASVAYHPFDHYVAIGLLSSANEPHPILIYTFEYPAALSMRTVANLRRTFGSRSTNVSGSGDAQKKESIRSQGDEKGDISEKFRSIIQKLDEVTGGTTPQIANVAAQLMEKGSIHEK